VLHRSAPFAAYHEQKMNITLIYKSCDQPLPPAHPSLRDIPVRQQRQDLACNRSAIPRPGAVLAGATRSCFGVTLSRMGNSSGASAAGAC
jgi:hypothetical protein